jgi:uncharacterized Zn-finger protein
MKSKAELTYISRRWHFKMGWCRRYGLAPDNAEAWNRAEAAWIAMNLDDRSKTTMTQTTKRKIVKQSITIRVEGKRFFCKCGANVFHEFDDGSVGCNACGTVYEESDD